MKIDDVDYILTFEQKDFDSNFSSKVVWKLRGYHFKEILIPYESKDDQIVLSEGFKQMVLPQTCLDAKFGCYITLSGLNFKIYKGKGSYPFYVKNLIKKNGNK
jgi:hypothetical protein